jgi:hypothetical protein
LSNPEAPAPDEVEGFVEAGGYVSMEAAHFFRKVETNGITWGVIPNLGRTLDAVAPFPVTSEPITAGGNAPHLEYRIYLFTPGDLTVRLFHSPTLNFNATDGLRYAVSIDDGEPVVVNIHEGETNRIWEEWVRNNVIKTDATVHVDAPGEHILKYWVVDPAVVLQKIVVETDDVPPSYLGPPESFRGGEL